ncbi:hypothetical protein P152DRAFT_466711 [Eremomyces bilateralis CBS 781.70]|uniref:Uncharacterized protein n=1 Tax=Eremomyces bilateralis CBS 781.70 TaxID=1392243 RepID=A0A6G1G3A3_9PEZI|nr:uncharacterized protein P152DRAFT_466711 [Eremomyces bilateralis CBS 781.70]KAF1812396.1 hypothetical protein P152DRAFT_466711 [Eremomyces bilateralis CBS 781.70]
MAADKLKPETVEQENGGYDTYGSKPSAGQRVKAHLKRRWWVHLIIFLLIVLLVVLLIIFVAFPKIAQKEVNKAEVVLVSEVVTDPTPDSVQLKLVSRVLSDSKYHPKIDAFEAALYLEDTLPDIIPFVYVTIPEMISKSDVTAVVEQRVTIANQEQFARYNKLALASEKFNIGLQGRPKIHVGKLPVTTVDFNKIVESKGLNGLAGFKIESFEIKLPAEPDGSNMVGTVFIPNPSPLDFTMGDVTLDIFVAGKLIGNSTLANLHIAPGENRLPLRSIVEQTEVISLVTSTYQDGMLPVDIVGRSAVDKDGQHLTYFEEALKGNSMHTELNVGEALTKMGIDLNALTSGSG